MKLLITITELLPYSEFLLLSNSTKFIPVSANNVYPSHHNKSELPDLRPTALRKILWTDPAGTNFFMKSSY